jgi:hypothetical protein
MLCCFESSNLKIEMAVPMLLACGSREMVWWDRRPTHIFLHISVYSREKVASFLTQLLLQFRAQKGNIPIFLKNWFV